MPRVSIRHGIRFCVAALLGGALCSLPWDAGQSWLVAEDAAAKPASPDKSATAEDPVLKEMLARARNLDVRFPPGDKSRPAELHPTPLIHYSDQVRDLPESTLWTWELDHVPVLFCKVERLVSKTTSRVSWQYCCVPACEDQTDVIWKRDFRWRSKEVAFKWTSIPDLQPPHPQPSGRLIQLKGVARHFGCEVKGRPEAGSQQSRLLPHPLHRFASPETNVQDGAVFGLTSNGTNPDVLVLVEALKSPVGESHWRYAVIGMTGDAAKVRFQDQPVWSKEVTAGPGDHKSWVWYLSTQ